MENYSAQDELTRKDKTPVPFLTKEIEWLKSCILYRLGKEQNSLQEPAAMPSATKISGDDCFYSRLISEHGINDDERLILILALSVHLDPNILHLFVEDRQIYRKAKLHKAEHDISILPTVETALFIIAGDSLEKRIGTFRYFQSEHIFYKKSILQIGSVDKDEPENNGILNVSQTYRDLLIENRYRKPQFSEDFPAHPITTALEWDDLVLMPYTRDRLGEVTAYLEHYDTLVNKWGMKKHAKKGCRILFYGDPGTGKTLAASLLGKHLKKEVYRVDISAVTSKYVGETSKRLNSLFNVAESKGWIIFFDEGDALFGQRQSNDSGSSSQYANQDVAFLLQRIENYDGIVIMATNLKNNIDIAFTRRFQSIVKFQLPEASLQLQFWKENLPKECPLAPEINLEQIVQRFSLSPASIINVIFRACTLALKKNTASISLDDLTMCLKDEEFNYKGRNVM